MTVPPGAAIVPAGAAKLANHLFQRLAGREQSGAAERIERISLSS